MAFVWKKEFETGHPLVDFQHRQLFNAFITLMEVCTAGKTKDRVRGTSDFLVSFAAKHLHDMECERLQNGYQYPFRFNEDYSHANLVNFVTELKEKLKDEGPSLELKEKIGLFLKNALVNLVNHINKEKEVQIALELDSMTGNDKSEYDIGYENRLHVKCHCPYCSNPAHYPVA